MNIVETKRTAILVICTSLSILAGCASSGGGSDLQRPQTSECPVGMMLICEGRGEPSRGGAEEEIPNYDRCICRIEPT